MENSHFHVKSQLIIYKIIKSTTTKGNNNMASRSSYEEKNICHLEISRSYRDGHKNTSNNFFFFFCGKGEWFESYTLTIR